MCKRYIEFAVKLLPQLIKTHSIEFAVNCIYKKIKKLTSQSVPKYPTLQIHLNMPTKSTHSPPFLHGELAHSFISVEQSRPVKNQRIFKPLETSQIMIKITCIPSSTSTMKIIYQINTSCRIFTLSVTVI